jgi:hypothetical protein
MTVRLTEVLSRLGPAGAVNIVSLLHLHKGLSQANEVMLGRRAAVCRRVSVRPWDSCGERRRDPDLWGFCGPFAEGVERAAGREGRDGPDVMLAHVHGQQM